MVILFKIASNKTFVFQTQTSITNYVRMESTVDYREVREKYKIFHFKDLVHNPFESCKGCVQEC